MWTDLFWILPCVFAILGVAAVSLWARTPAGRVATGEKLLKVYRRDEAETHFRAVTEGGSKNAVTVRACLGLAESLRQRGMHSGDDGAPLLRQSVATLEQALVITGALPGMEPDQAELNDRIGSLKSLLGEQKDALPYLRAAAQYYGTLKDDTGKHKLSFVLGTLGRCLYQLNKHDEAIPTLERYLALQDKDCLCEDLLFDASELAPSLCYVFALVEMKQGAKAAEVMQRYLEQAKQLEQQIKADDKDADRLNQVEILQVLYGRVLLRLNRREDAFAMFNNAIERRKADGVFSPSYAQIVDAALENYKVADSEPARIMARVIEDKSVLSDDDVRLLSDLQRLGVALCSQKKAADAERYLRRAFELERKFRPAVVPASQALLVQALMMQRKVKEAKLLSDLPIKG